MEIIFVTQARRNRRRLHFGTWGSRFLAIVSAGLLVGAFALGFKAGDPPNRIPQELHAAAWAHEVAKQQRLVQGNIDSAQANVDALASKLAELQARVVRLDALGGRLVELADLDNDEFSFGLQPGVGGVPSASAETFTVPDFVGELRSLSDMLTDRTPKLEAIESAMMNARLLAQIHPRGRPVVKGWLSSKFGWRADPITGRKSFHEGLDFAGPKNSPVIAVAAGIVQWAGRRTGYGKVLEVNHGNGYVTRYAHNAKNLVKIGQRVHKGQKLALMGATGHATGTHVHFEVLKNGEPIDPLSMVRRRD